ncbi:hypothetical protein SRHO_G00177510 [Serrasalmus rhombeus]
MQKTSVFLGKVSLFDSPGGLTVTYRNLSLQDAGLYQCGETRVWSHDVNLKVNEDPCCLTPNTVSGYLGETVTISCSYPEQFEMNRKLFYKLHDQHFTAGIYSAETQRGRFSMSDDRRSKELIVKISDVREDDGGVYFCGAVIGEEFISYNSFFTEIQLKVSSSPVLISINVCVVLLLIGGLALIFCIVIRKKRPDFTPSFRTELSDTTQESRVRVNASSPSNTSDKQMHSTVQPPKDQEPTYTTRDCDVDPQSVSGRCSPGLFYPLFITSPIAILQYTAAELLRLRFHPAGPPPVALHLHPDIAFNPRHKYIHRGSRLNFTTSDSDSIQSFWSRTRRPPRNTDRGVNRDVLAHLARSANSSIKHRSSNVNFGLLNVRSLTGKGHLIQDVLRDCSCCLRPKTVSGYLGETVTISCSYPEEFEMNHKLFYKLHDQHFTPVIHSAETQRGRFSMSDDRGSKELIVKISDVREDDGGVYYCGVGIGGEFISYNSFFTEIQLKVTGELHELFPLT